MNNFKTIAVLALICGAPLLQAQVLGGNAAGGLGGGLGGTLGSGMGSMSGNGQGAFGGNLGGTFDHGDALRRHAGNAVDRTRDVGSRVHDRADNTRSAAQGAGESAVS